MACLEKVAWDSNFAFHPIEASWSSSTDSSAMVTKKPARTAAPFKPHELLYPMRELPRDSGQDGNEVEQVEIDVPQTRWVGMTPLNMVSKIVSLAAEKSPEFGPRLQGSCLRVFLSCRSSDSHGVHAGEKRKTEQVDEIYIDTDEEADRLAESLVKSHGSKKIHPDSVFKGWKPLGILAKTKEVAHLDDLSKKFEHVVIVEPKKKYCIPSYNRVQQAFFSQVASTAITDAGKFQLAVDAAMKRATAQMQVLTGMASTPEQKAKTAKTNALLGPERSIKAMAKAKRLGSVDFCGSARGVPVNDINEALDARNEKEKKGAFQEYMIEWMMNNFANPFPDDAMLVNLAKFLLIQARCITISKKEAEILKDHNKSMVDIAIEKITNWLVNMRTRRWRPSISDAFDAKRPASNLLEDSMRIFRGRELRPMENWDGEALFASDPRYSTPLKTWKKKRRFSKAAVEAITKAIAPKSYHEQSVSSSEDTSPKPGFLNNFTHPPATEISPMCSQMDRLMEAADIVAYESV